MSERQPQITAQSLVDMYMYRNMAVSSCRHACRTYASSKVVQCTRQNEVACSVLKIAKEELMCCDALRHDQLF